jgi:hypothetical protein
VEARTDEHYSLVIKPVLCVRGKACRGAAVLLSGLDVRSREIIDAVSHSSVACPSAMERAASARRDGIVEGRVARMDGILVKQAVARTRQA